MSLTNRNKCTTNDSIIQPWEKQLLEAKQSLTNAGLPYNQSREDRYLQEFELIHNIKNDMISKYTGFDKLKNDNLEKIFFYHANKVSMKSKAQIVKEITGENLFDDKQIELIDTGISELTTELLKDLQANIKLAIDYMICLKNTPSNFLNLPSIFENEISLDDLLEMKARFNEI
jgi:hypothetical protein